LRVTAQLINVADGYHLWSQRFDRELKDVFDVQDELARAIVGMLSVKLPGEQPRGLVRRYTANPQAHELCMKGRYYFFRFTREGFQKGIECFEKARMEDPGCAPAYAGLATTYCGLAIFGWARPREVVPKGKQAALEALAIEATDATAHMALATIRHWYEWDWAGAESEYRRAIELSPGDPMNRGLYAEFLAYLGRYEESIEQASRAVSLDPVSLEAKRELAVTLLFARRYEEAADQCRRALELESNFYPIHAILALVCGVQGRYQEARRAAEQARSLAPGEPMCEAFLGWALGAAGERAQATAILDEVMKRRREAYFPASLVSMIHLGLGDPNAAYLWVETAFEERDPQLLCFAASAAADPLLPDLRFRELLRKIGLRD
jgi:serine/threonine-protein kinase